jgi:hypothetical protein
MPSTTTTAAASSTIGALVVPSVSYLLGYERYVTVSNNRQASYQLESTVRSAVQLESGAVAAVLVSVSLNEDGLIVGFLLKLENAFYRERREV